MTCMWAGEKHRQICKINHNDLSLLSCTSENSGHIFLILCSPTLHTHIFKQTCIRGVHCRMCLVHLMPSKTHNHFVLTEGHRAFRLTHTASLGLVHLDMSRSDVQSGQYFKTSAFSITTRLTVLLKQLCAVYDAATSCGHRSFLL